MIDRVTGGAGTSSGSTGSQPAAPAVILTPDRSDTAIDVVWSPVPGVTSYDVFRIGPGDTDFRQIATIGGLSYGDAGLKPATQYQYKVRASSAREAGLFSPVASEPTLRRVPRCDDPGNCAVR